MILIENRKARFEYDIHAKYQAGVMLSGAEVKSLRQKSGSLTGSFVKIVGSQVLLLNAQISPYKFADNRDYDPRRTRTLLLNKKELMELLAVQNQKGSVLVPLAFELAGKLIKLTVGVGKGKKLYEKRAALKQRDIERDLRRDLKDTVHLR